MTGESEDDKLLKQRVERAREDRTRFAPTYNQFYDLAAPYMKRVGIKNDTNNPESPEDQDEVFDNTLQEAVDDFASDMNDEFTPGYRPWTKHVASEEFRQSEKERVEKVVKDRMTAIYDRIRESNFEEAAQGFYTDLAIGPGMVSIPFTRVGKPVGVEHVPLHEILIEPGPFGGVDGRWRERQIRVCDLDRVYPNIDWDEAIRGKGARSRQLQTIPVIEGFHRDWEANRETWVWTVYAHGKVRRRRKYTGRGSCGLLPVRTKVSAPSAYGLGPGHKALAPARTLDQLAYLELKRLGKIVDPPGFYDEDGLFNPEQGINAGEFYPRAPGSKIDLLEPKNDMREAFFKKDELQMAVKRALFQDKPMQKGETPPTLGQWLDMKSENSRRMSFPRARLHREWVLPVLHRFEWIMERRGEIEEVEIGGRVVRVEPISPLSRAADIDDVQAATQLLDVVAGRLPQAIGVIDMQTTVENLKKKMGDDLVKILEDEEIMQRQLAQTMGGEAPGGPGV